MSEQHKVEYSGQIKQHFSPHYAIKMTDRTSTVRAGLHTKYSAIALYDNDSLLHILSCNIGRDISEFPIHCVARYGYVWRPGLQRCLSMPGNPPTVLRHFTTPRGKDQRTVDYVGNRKVRMNFLNRFYVDLTSILLNVILLAALWFFV